MREQEAAGTVQWIRWPSRTVLVLRPLQRHHRSLHRLRQHTKILMPICGQATQLQMQIERGRKLDSSSSSPKLDSDSRKATLRILQRISRTVPYMLLQLRPQGKLRPSSAIVLHTSHTIDLYPAHRRDLAEPEEIDGMQPLLLPQFGRQCSLGT